MKRIPIYIQYDVYVEDYIVLDANHDDVRIKLPTAVYGNQLDRLIEALQEARRRVRLMQVRERAVRLVEEGGDVG